MPRMPIVSGIKEHLGGCIEEKLKFILRALPMKKGHAHGEMIRRIMEDCGSYFSEGIWQPES